jgi:hypothetical protein
LWTLSLPNILSISEAVTVPCATDAASRRQLSSHQSYTARMATLQRVLIRMAHLRSYLRTLGGPHLGRGEPHGCGQRVALTIINPVCMRPRPWVRDHPSPTAHLGGMIGWGCEATSPAMGAPRGATSLA